MMMDKYKTVVILCGPVVATSGAQNVTFLWSHRAILKEWGGKKWCWIIIFLLLKMGTIFMILFH